MFRQLHTYVRGLRAQDTTTRVGAAFVRLKFAFTFALLAQVCLSGAAVYVSSVLMENNARMLQISHLAGRQQELFQEIGFIAHRLSKEIDKPVQNARSIPRMQQRLTQCVTALETININISSLTTQLSSRQNMVDSANRQYDKLLNDFLQNARFITTLDPDRTLTALPHWQEIELAVAPEGVTNRWLKSLISDASKQAEKGAEQMRWFLMLLNLASLLVVVVIGLTIAYPALRNQKNAILRERKLLQNLHDQAMRDGLTNLHNRKSCDKFMASLQQAAPCKITIATIDLNMFKPINDTFGHDAGDAVLIEVAHRLTRKAGQGAFVARTGGDEFIIIYKDLDDISIERAAERLLSVFDKPISHKAREHTIGGCIGLASALTTDEGFLDLASNADAAMFSLKGQRKTRYALYDPDTFTAKLDLRRRDELVHALKEGHIKPYFQPQVRLSDKRVTGFEALARWTHETEGVLEAKTFLPDIETFGLQFEFSYILLKSVCQHLEEWSKQDIDPFNVSVNVSEIALATEDGFRDIEWLLTEYAHLRDRLTFEVTENVFLARYELPIRQSVHRLSEMGMRISMDDFGTGYGSFRHLKEFTFHELKIDEEFVAGIGKETSSEVLISGFLAIAKGLNANVVAEGIETEEQERFLLSQGCGFGQGFLYGAAVEAENVLDLVARNDPHQTPAKIG